MRPVARKLFVGIAIAAAILLLAEALCRLSLPPEPVGTQAPIYAPDEAAGFRVAGGLRFEGFTTNRLGARGGEPDPAARERILVLGDSMTLGAEVADGETFCARLAEARGAGVTVVNAGCPGYGPAEELAALRRLAADVGPSRVVVVFFLGNDFLDAGQDGGAYRVVAGRLVAKARYEEATALGRAGREALARLWSLGIVRAARRLGGRGAAEAPPDPNGPVGMDSPAIRALLELDDYGRAGERGAPLVARGWERLPGLFTNFREECARLGAPLTVAVLPLPIAYDRDLRVRLAQLWGVAPASIDAQRPARRLAALLGALGIATVDLAPAFERAGGGAALHLPGDLHLSAQGHRAAASGLSEALR